MRKLCFTSFNWQKKTVAMGNKESIQEEHARSCSNSDERVFTMDNTDRGRMHSTDQTVAVVKLFEVRYVFFFETKIYMIFCLYHVFMSHSA